MGKFSVDSVLPLIFRFLVKSGYQKTATKLQKETDIDLSQATIPLHKKKLAAIIERYTNDNPEVLISFDEQGKAKASSGRRQSIDNGSQLGKRKASEASDAGLIKSKAKKAAKKLAEDEDDEEEIEQKPVKKRKSSVVPVEEEKPKKKWIPGEAIKNMPKGVNRPQMRSLMSRVDQRFIEGQHKTSIQNQVSFEEKQAFGIDEVGMSGYERLGGTQGKEFRKQKNKLKNRSSYVGSLTLQDNTIAFE